MSQFIAFLFLLFMIIPALVAVSVGSRSVFGFIWNGIWFYIIGQTAQTAFNSPDAQFIGVALAILFIWRSLVFKRRPAPFSFQVGGFPGGNFRTGTFGAGRPFGADPFRAATQRRETPPSSDTAPNDMREVIEAEVIEAHTTEIGNEGIRGESDRTLPRATRPDRKD